MLKPGFAGGGDGSSPLKLFTNAKKKMNSIYGDIGVYVEDFSEFVENVKANKEEELIKQDLEDLIRSCLEKVSRIQEMLHRDHMKVVFFGRTSNGKSTVINAMLCDKILPSGLGHTTNCFLSIEGCSDKDAPYLLCGDSDEKRNVQSVSQLGHAFSQECMSNDSLIRVMWPKKKCTLLKHEVVLVDSPGIDLTEDMDKWIDQYCLDADVFIHVANVESALSLAEKKFFHKVNSKLSKPNIFILNNRWDLSAAEPELMEQLREQHLKRGISFLADELKVVSAQQAKDRVFFVSAKETLNARLQKLRGMPESGGALAEGFKARLVEFSTFERNFEECISCSATRTRFHQHAHGAQSIVDSFLAQASILLDVANSLKSECDACHEDVESKIAFVEKQIKQLTTQVKEVIKRLVCETEFQVRQAMSDEIRRLSLLVHEFDKPFHQNQIVLEVYKGELYRHVEEVLGRNLATRCSASLKNQINRSKQGMVDESQQLFDCKLSQNDTALQIAESTFEVSYDINCANLCSDFQEDIEFKFSLGLRSLMNRFSTGRRSLTAISSIPRPMSQSQDIIAQPKDDASVEDVALGIAAEYFKARGANSASLALGVVMVPYALWKTMGWRVVIFIGASYGALYLYERLTWTSRAQENALKRQFVEHATEKLNLITSFTSSNCSHQVQQELSTGFAQICHKVDQIKDELQEESKRLQDKSDRLSTIASKLKTLRNKANFLSGDIHAFTSNYLGV